MEDLKALIVTHIAFNPKTGNAVEGPYTSVTRALQKLSSNQPRILQIPLRGFEGPIIYQSETKKYQIRLPKIIGTISPVKYFFDFIISFFLTLQFLVREKNRKSVLVIAVDPLSGWSPLVLRLLFPFKLVYYCVDFSKSRSKNPILQNLYELADRLCSQRSDQTWVVCESLQDYKRQCYESDSLYIPNSFPFDGSYFSQNRGKRTGNRVVWTGSILTDKQITDIFRLCHYLQKLRPEIEFWFIPSNRHKDFYQNVKQFNLEGAQIFEVGGQEPSRRLVSQCDLGLAIYDPRYGSTRFIEPIKIWEYLMCGLPFVISCEPSVSQEIKNSGVVFFLGPNNKIPRDGSLGNFIKADNLKRLVENCLALAKQFDAVETIKAALERL